MSGRDRDHAPSPPGRDHAPSSIGARLRAAREARGWSLEDVSSRLKLRPELLALIEADEFARLPEPIITRSYLRAYAQVLELDPASIVDAYGRAAPPPRVQARRSNRVLPLVGAILVAIVVVAGIAYYVNAGLRSRVPAAPAATPEAPAAAGEPDTVRFSVTSAPPGARVTVDGFFLGRTPLKNALVSAAASRELRVERPGYRPYVRSLEFRRDRSISVTLELLPKPAPTPKPAPGPASPAEKDAAPAGTSSAPPAATSPATTPSTAPSTTPSTAPSAASTAEPPAATAPSSAQVTLSFRGRSWVRVTTADGRVLFEGIPEVGSTLTYPGPVTVRAGNPAAVAATAGGQSRDRLGPGSSPVTVQLP